MSSKRGRAKAGRGLRLLSVEIAANHFNIFLFGKGGGAKTTFECGEWPEGPAWGTWADWVDFANQILAHENTERLRTGRKEL